MTTSRKSQPDEPVISPITFRPCSNGEFEPIPETARDRRAGRLFQEVVAEKSRRLGMSRRAFAESACGMVAALYVINTVYGCGSAGSKNGQRSGNAAGASGSFDAGYDVEDAALEDQAHADVTTSGDEFIFDVQVHSQAPDPPWRPQDLCAIDAPECVAPPRFIREIFVASDTEVACLSGAPSSRENDPLSTRARARIKEIVDQLSGSPRLVIHSNVRPNLGQIELDFMEEDARAFPVVAWKVYPSDGSWRLDSQEIGQPFIERARQLGIKRIAAHRGLSQDAGGYADLSSPVDLVSAAKQNPDFVFLTYHSGYEATIAEDHPFDPNDPNPKGIDRLIKAVLDYGIGNTGNVYAELGTTWRNLMTQPVAAAHALGKLLKYLGPERILWGTDCLFTGSPAEQIAAFRTFQIPVAMQEAFGYPEIDSLTRRKIFGLNAAHVYGVDPSAVRREISDDDIANLKLSRASDPRSVPLPNHKHYGPRTRREFLAFKRFAGELA